MEMIGEEHMKIKDVIKRKIKTAFYQDLVNKIEDLQNELETLRTFHGESITKINLMYDMINENIAFSKELYKESQAYLDKKELENHIHIDLIARDIMIALNNSNSYLPREKITLQTNSPIAEYSLDHKKPRGTKNDNTRAPFFINKCESLFGKERKLNFLDLGCAGGGIVLDAILKGHLAIGLDGSDYSLVHQRAEWRLLTENLKTCDITEDFQLYIDGNEAKFDIISAWEVLEHIPEDKVANMLKNIKKHLSDDGYFVATIAQFGDYDSETGESYHVNLNKLEWWENIFEQNGFIVKRGIFEPNDMARAHGNPPLPWIIDWPNENSPYITVQLAK